MCILYSIQGWGSALVRGPGATHERGLQIPYGKGLVRSWEGDPSCDSMNHF